MTVNERGAVIQGTAEAAGNGDSWQNDFEYGNSSNNNKSVGINFDYQVNDNLNLTLDYHDSSAKFKEHLVELKITYFPFQMEHGQDGDGGQFKRHQVS